jgi:hypothetical protein
VKSENSSDQQTVKPLWKTFLWVNVAWFLWTVFLWWNGGVRVFCEDSLFCDVSTGPITLAAMGNKAVLMLALQIFVSSLITWLIARERRKAGKRDQ